MSVPVRRQTHGKTRRRRAHHALSSAALSECPKCKKPVQPHHACENCGYYGKKQIVDTSRETERALRRQAKADAPADIETASADAEKKAQVNQADQTKTEKPGK